jgi:S-adenosyl-L-methionine hydrolase (adenosine-forming)
MAAGVPRPPIIALLTDFGLEDAYVGIMKGVILSLSPEARLVDLSHEVPPQDVLSGALVLQSAWRYFPPGTIHLAVVDPGVGSRRRAMAAACGEQFLVGPDNGVFSLIFAEQTPLTVISLENPHYFLANVATTFHGRDIFAPVAAHLSLGVPLTAFGPALFDPVRLDFPAPEFREAEVNGQIISVDHFGNLISNIPFESLQIWLRGRSASLRVNGRVIPHLATTYSDVSPGALLALCGSHGYLEIACRQGRAAQVLNAAVGARVQVNISHSHINFGKME